MRLTLSVIKADIGSVGGDDSGRRGRGRHAEANIPARIGSLRARATRLRGGSVWASDLHKRILAAIYPLTQTSGSSLATL